MTTFTEGNTLRDLLVSEVSGIHSREAAEFLADAAMGAVLGRVLFACPTTGTAVAGGTGNGTMADVLAGDLAEVGTYRITCVTAAANGGTFKVLSPSGARLDDAKVGTAYASPHLSFLISDGAADFAVGDAFTVAVAAGSGKVKPLDLTAHDGSQLAAGVALYDVDVSEKAEGTILRRDGVVIQAGLVWSAGATDSQKAAALAQLAKRGIDAITEA